VEVLIPELSKDTVDTSIPMTHDKYYSIYKGEYTIQLYAFRADYRAKNVHKKLEGDREHPLIIVIQRNLYKLRITGFKTRKEARVILVKLREDGYSDAFIVKAKQ
jgi:cell division septation protein DedD